MTDELRTAARTSKAWPFEEARKLVKRWPEGKPDGAPMLFETGYGPSGLPHIGTFNEVLRTTMIRRAYEALTGQPTRLLAFSDDMDGLRKVPDNVPNQAMLNAHLGRPLTDIPDPFGKFDSFAAHNNAMLRDFLDRFGFAYEFASSTDYYRSGRFDEQLKAVLRHYDAILAVMLPTLGAERQATYSPVLPISRISGRVLQVPVTVLDPEAGLIAYEEEGERVEASILGGAAKLQWKADWAMRWVALGVDYEMYGKDLTDSGVLSGQIARILGGRKPEGMIYELFLDAEGRKISKSKGNGLALEDWLKYGPPESVAVHAYREPKSAKPLSLGVIPRAIDEYWQFVGGYPAQRIEQKLGNPAHHIHDGAVPTRVPPVTFGLLLNLVGVLGADARADQVWRYLGNYNAAATAEEHPELGPLIDHALAYHRDVVAPTLKRRPPQGAEIAALDRLDHELAALPADADAGAIQNIVYAIGNDGVASGDFAQLRDWFQTLYETLLGSPQGPRMGSFIALYGIGNSRRLIAEALEAGRETGRSTRG